MIDDWCAARMSEVLPAEVEAVRGREERARARFAKTLRESGETPDMYELIEKGIAAMFREEGLMVELLPLPVEVGELMRRLKALPTGSAARAWGKEVADLRARLLAIDVKLKQGDMQAAKHADDFAKPGVLEAQAAQAGVARCATLMFISRRRASTRRSHSLPSPAQAALARSWPQSTSATVADGTGRGKPVCRTEHRRSGGRRAFVQLRGESGKPPTEPSV